MSSFMDNDTFHMLVGIALLVVVFAVRFSKGGGG